MERRHNLAALLFASVMVTGWPCAYAASDEAARPVPDASPGRDRRPAADAGSAERPVRDDATGGDALGDRGRATGPTGNDTGTRGTDGTGSGTP